MNIDTNVKQLVTDFTCAFCDSNAGFDVEYSDTSESYTEYGDYVNGIAFAIVKCQRCKMLHILTFDIIRNDFGPHFSEEWEAAQYRDTEPDVLFVDWDLDEPRSTVVSLHLLGQYPFNRPFNSHIPESVRSELKEAGSCLAFGAYKAAAVMCGRALEHVVQKYLPEETGTLSGRGTMGKLISVEEALRPPDTESDKKRDTNSNKQIVPTPVHAALSEAFEWRHEGAHICEKFYKNPAGIRDLFELTVATVEYVYAESNLGSLTQNLASAREKNKL